MNNISKQIKHVLNLIQNADNNNNNKMSRSKAIKEIADYADEGHEKLLFILSNHCIYVGNQAWDKIDTLIRSDVNNDEGLSHHFSVLSKDAAKADWLENEFYGHTAIIEDPCDIPDTLLIGADYKVPSLDDIKNALTNELLGTKVPSFIVFYHVSRHFKAVGFWEHQL